MLGFDSFTSKEYMPDVSDTTPTGWVKDYVLTDEILKCLDSSDDPIIFIQFPYRDTGTIQ